MFTHKIGFLRKNLISTPSKVAYPNMSSTAYKISLIL